MKKLHKILSGLKSRYWKVKLPVINGTLAGKPVRAVKGTIRKEPDKDDAWLFWLMGQFNSIYDIGANIGQSALFAKIQHPGKKLLLVDPNPEALSIAAKNLILNNWCGHCHFECAFVAERSQEQVQFYTVGVGAAGSMYKGHAQTASAVGASMLVPTITLDDLYDKYGWLPEFVKIDVEGAESKVLQGANKIASHLTTWFMIEMHSPPELPMLENAALILDWCERNRYKPWYMRNRKILDAPALIGDRGRCHLLLLPENEKYPASLGTIEQGSPLPS